MKKPSKTQIKKALRNQNTTEIFKIAKMYGIDINEKINIYNFIKEFAPSQKVYKNAYKLSFGCADFKNFRIKHTTINQPIKEVIRWAKYQKEKCKGTNYLKNLILGNSNIYWASPIYKHQDYNKSIALKNTPKNRILAEKINSFINS